MAFTRIPCYDYYRKDLLNAQREYKKKKAEKKRARQKQLEEEREQEKNKWLSFNAKVKEKSSEVSQYGVAGLHVEKRIALAQHVRMNAQYVM